jgi:alpha-beta hydrolase superfamily lysophospholipase
MTYTSTELRGAPGTTYRTIMAYSDAYNKVFVYEDSNVEETPLLLLNATSKTWVRVVRIDEHPH